MWHLHSGSAHPSMTLKRFEKNSIDFQIPEDHLLVELPLC